MQRVCSKGAMKMGADGTELWRHQTWDGSHCEFFYLHTPEKAIDNLRAWLNELSTRVERKLNT